MNNSSLQVFNYNGVEISKRDDGYINLTQMCQANGRQVNDFFRLKSTKEYLAELSTSTGIPVNQLQQVFQGSGSIGGGSWGHPLVALRMAQWISPKFAVWCDAHIFNLMATGTTSMDIDPIEEMKLKIRLAELENQKAQTELSTLHLRNTIVQTCPEPIQQRILGYQTIKETEVIEHHVTPYGTYDGVGITYLQKRYGFRNTKQAWDFLERIGYGKDSGKWEASYAAVERMQLPRELVDEIDDRFTHAGRQRFIGE